MQQNKGKRKGSATKQPTKTQLMQKVKDLGLALTDRLEMDQRVKDHNDQRLIIAANEFRGHELVNMPSYDRRKLIDVILIAIRAEDLEMDGEGIQMSHISSCLRCLKVLETIR